TYPHMVQPRLVYMSFPSELGDIYSAKELSDIYSVCKKHGLLLFVDGARLGYGLMSEKSDVSLPFLADHCDVFYIGGTKGGAMFGEAVVFSNIPAPKYFFTTVKRHGALLAKGRMLGIQFDTLFTDDLYFKAARHAIVMAERMKGIFTRHGISFGADSPTNQQFVILSREQKEQLSAQIAFEVWSPLPDDRLLCRFVTSWATTDADLESLDRALD
ncbi:MAG: amino acid lyase, partial [Bacteroidales bacterium]|nr:amino acid lyase [Bacteroidales bacterium]